MQQLSEALDGLVQSTNYKGQYEIKIKEQNVKVNIPLIFVGPTHHLSQVHVFNPAAIARAFTSVFWSLLLLVLLIYPFLWLWRRYWPSKTE